MAPRRRVRCGHWPEPLGMMRETPRESKDCLHPPRQTRAGGQASAATAIDFR